MIDKLNEIDSEFGLKLNQELEEALKVEEETIVQNGIDVVHNGVAMLAVTEDWKTLIEMEHLEAN